MHSKSYTKNSSLNILKTHCHDNVLDLTWSLYAIILTAVKTTNSISEAIFVLDAHVASSVTKAILSFPRFGAFVLLCNCHFENAWCNTVVLAAIETTFLLSRALLVLITHVSTLITKAFFTYINRESLNISSLIVLNRTLFFLRNVLKTSYS